MPASISYLEDLSPTDLLWTLENIQLFQATEKLDGSQLLFGIDDHGFYTSRESKGGDRIYSIHEYPLTFSCTYRRFAHAFLSKNLKYLVDAGLQPGDQIEIEVLYGAVPNVVPYGIDVNSIVFIRSTQGNLDFNKFTESINHFSDSITLLVPFTRDGIEIEYEDRTESWKSYSIPEVDVDHARVKKELDKKIFQLREYLESESGIPGMNVVSAYCVPLNRKPDGCKNWSELKDLLKSNRHKVDSWLEVYRENLKQFMLDTCVMGRNSKLGSSTSWIEGIVFSYSNSRLKIVDKKTFGEVRKFSWFVRNSLSSSHPADMSFTYVLKKTVQGLLNSGQNFSVIRFSLCQFLELKKKELLDKLDKYKENRSNYYLDVERLGRIVYDNNINERTLEVFSSVFLLIENLNKQVIRAKNLEDLKYIFENRYLT